MNLEAAPPTNGLQKRPRLQHQNPWFYVPLLYFLQALPVTLVQDVTSLVYKSFGIPNESITRWTAIVSLPWALQMLVGPLVDLNSTKRNWAIYGQIVLAGLLGLVAVSLRLPNPFEISLVGFFAIAVVSTLCNTATDGFYLLSLDQESRAKFVGVQTTCYRLGLLFCKGGLVWIAGYLNGRSGTAGWSIAYLIAAGIFVLGFIESRLILPFPSADTNLADSRETTSKTIKQTAIILTIGLSIYFALSSIVRLLAESAWKIFDGSATGPLKGWILSNDPKMIGISVGNNGIFAEIAQLVLCIIIFFWAMHLADRTIRGSEFGEAFASYFRQPGIVAILFFLMFYRFGEAMLVKMAPLFLADKRSVGGLGLSTEQIAGIIGSAGVVGIVCGGLLGGWVVSKVGLRKSFWAIALCMHLPNLLYLWASYAHPGSWAMYPIAFIEQFGYGFGFAGYIVYQMMVAKRGHFPTSHYALGVGIGALFIAVAFVVSGIIQANFGYHGLFISVIFMSIPGLLSILFIPIDPRVEEAH